MHELRRRERRVTRREIDDLTFEVAKLTDKVIVVQKGDERWEVARDEKTRIDGELKVGNKVTIHYRMLAVSVETKAAGKTEKSESTKKTK